MKTKINLYSASLLPPKLSLSLNRLAVMTFLLMLLSLVIYGLMTWQLNQQQADLAQAEKLKTSLEQQKAQLEAQIAARLPNAELVAEVELKQQRLALKQQLKGELATRKSIVSGGYSNLLLDLAKVSDQSVWLSKIVVSQGKYEFEGFGSSAQSIPIWIDRLKTTDTLKGYSFAAMTMNRGENQPLGFKLTSQPDEKVAQ